MIWRRLPAVTIVGKVIKIKEIAQENPNAFLGINPVCEKCLAKQMLAITDAVVDNQNDDQGCLRASLICTIADTGEE